MITLYRNCIFCLDPLPDPRIGDGEHVIPKSIFGFLKSHDVCPSCIDYFGQDVDCLAIKNIRLLEALKTLEIANPDKLLEQIPWQGKDLIDGSVVEMVKKGDEFRTKVIQQEDFMECADSNLESVAKPWLWNKVRGNLTKDEFEREYKLFQKEYMKVNPGETYHSKCFGYSFKKRQVNDIQPKQYLPDNFTRLLAKIAYIYLYLSVAPNQIDKIEEMQNLRDHARYGKPLGEYTINSLGFIKGKKPERYHSISLYPDKHISLLDIQFFGFYAWRTVLHTPLEFKVTSNSHDQPLEIIRLILNFQDLTKREKLVGLKPFGTDQYEWRSLEA